MERFSNWLNSYTKSFNIKQRRRGGLFADYLKRTIIEDKHQLKASLMEIHAYPLNKGLCHNIHE